MAPAVQSNATPFPSRISMTSIHEAKTDGEITRCFSVMVQLRPHLEESAFVPVVRRQYAGGYRLAFLESSGAVQAVAGYRLLDNLVGGRVLYVDDLVTDSDARSRGYGKALLDWLAERGREQGCAFLELDSGVQRFDAHRFYFVNGMVISSHHFRRAL
jgi:GNAT superfamily N-acetyltransferase